MSLLSRFRRHRTPKGAATDEERIARYVYLLNTLPASVIESAHATAFKDVPVERRREMFERLRPFMSETEQAAASDDPTVLARLFRRAEQHRQEREASKRADASIATATRTTEDPRDAVDPRTVMLNAGATTIVANQFLLSATVATYFMYGAGSIGIADQPAWVGDAFDPSAAGFDGGGYGGGDYGGGGGFDGGGVGFGGGDFGGGGFDGGGFG